MVTQLIVIISVYLFFGLISVIMGLKADWEEKPKKIWYLWFFLGGIFSFLSFVSEYNRVARVKLQERARR